MAIREIVPEPYRISNYFPESDLQFNQFLVKEDEHLLFHTGMKGIFPLVRHKVTSIIDSVKHTLDRLQLFRGARVRLAQRAASGGPIRTGGL